MQPEGAGVTYVRSCYILQSPGLSKQPIMTERSRLITRQGKNQRAIFGRHRRGQP